MRKYRLKMNPLKCALCVQAGYFHCFVAHKKGIEINHNKIKAIMETQPPLTKKKEASIFIGEDTFFEEVYFKP